MLDRTPPAARLLPLLRELGDLKRIHSAGRRGSIAERLFRRSWSALVAGAEVGRIADAIAAEALAAARLGDLDDLALGALGLDEGERAAIRRRAIAELADGVEAELAARLRASVSAPDLPDAAPPAFVASLADQPRAGVTCPGKPRLMLQPAENHAEHCLTVAVYGLLLAPRYRADPAVVFLAGIAHHLHSASMPDSGFTGEVLLGGCLDAVIVSARAKALGMLAPALRARVEPIFAIIADADSPEGRAFHAADVLDRVLEIESHVRARAATMDLVLGDYELVHAGPVKAFHDRVLAEAGLA